MQQPGRSKPSRAPGSWVCNQASLGHKAFLPVSGGAGEDRALGVAGRSVTSFCPGAEEKKTWKREATFHSGDFLPHSHHQPLAAVTTRLEEVDDPDRPEALVCRRPTSQIIVLYVTLSGVQVVFEAIQQFRRVQAAAEEGQERGEWTPTIHKPPRAGTKARPARQKALWIPAVQRSN